MAVVGSAGTISSNPDDEFSQLATLHPTAAATYNLSITWFPDSDPITKAIATQVTVTNAAIDRATSSITGAWNPR
eukprot:scaffold652007_cov45-Prasinocladus_malaysianus.AAC.1